MTLDLHHNQFPPEEGPSLLYFPAEEEKGVGEFLFFEEHIIHDTSWKRASQKGKRLWQRMKDRYEQFACEAFAGDRFIRRIHRLRNIRILLNKPIETAIVKERLRKMMRDRSYHHLRWMFIDLLLLPFTLIIMIVPGPNIVGYYLLFRVISHWLAYRAASRTQLQDVRVEVSDHAQEVSALLRTRKDVRATLHELRKKYGIRSLQEHQFIPQSAVLKDVYLKLKARLAG